MCPEDWPAAGPGGPVLAEMVRARSSGVSLSLRLASVPCLDSGSPYARAACPDSRSVYARAALAASGRRPRLAGCAGQPPVLGRLALRGASSLRRHRAATGPRPARLARCAGRPRVFRGLALTGLAGGRRDRAQNERDQHIPIGVHLTVPFPFVTHRGLPAISVCRSGPRSWLRLRRWIPAARRRRGVTATSRGTPCTAPGRPRAT